MLIKSGSTGAHVRSFQHFLSESGFRAGPADGVAGPKTVNAIKAFQVRSGLVDDGMAGHNTLTVARASGWDWGKPTASQVKAANELELPVEVVQTIERVESGGKASAVRFEPHVFLRKRPKYKGKVPLTLGPAGFSTTARETDLAAFQHAYALDPVAAVESTSWGLYQVLGGHLLAIHGGPEEAVLAFDNDPVATSYALLVRWFKKNPLALMAAKGKDWWRLAKHYNGPGNVEKYSRLLRDAYKEFT